MDDDTAPEYYLTVNQGPDTPTVRTFDRDLARAHGQQTVARQHQRDDRELPCGPDRGSDPANGECRPGAGADGGYVRQARLPPAGRAADRFLQRGSTRARTLPAEYAWDHGDYAAEINANYIGYVGPGVKHLGLDGNQPNQGPSSAGPDSGQITVAQTHLAGLWTDETDIRPTLMYLTGLRDDYRQVDRALRALEVARDTLAGRAGGCCVR